MKSKNLLLIFLLIFVITACANTEADALQLPDEPVRNTPTIPPQGTRVGQEFTLDEGESIWIEKGLFEITLERVIGDSRCPANAECFWEGNVQVKVLVDEQSYTLTLGGLLEGDQNSVDLGDGLSLRLLKVDPYPDLEATEQPYQVTLVVERETSQPFNYPAAG